MKHRLEYAFRRSLSRNYVSRRIRKTDPRPVPANPDEIRLFMVARNESLRLPFTLEYYFSRGVDRIFVIDNDSSDDTASIVSSEKNAHLFHTKDQYRRQAYWIDFLLRRYGVGHWCLVVDADEVLIYPFCESISLRQLCSFLDKEHFQTLDCVLLDMYPDTALDGILYTRGTDPLLVAPWFDSGSYVSGMGGPRYIDDQQIIYDGPERLFGGMRKRIFGSRQPLDDYRRTCGVYRYIIESKVLEARRG